MLRITGTWVRYHFKCPASDERGDFSLRWQSSSLTASFKTLWTARLERKFGRLPRRQPGFEMPTNGSLVDSFLWKEIPMDSDEILLDCEERMEKAAELYHNQLGGLRTGRASAGLVDSVRVEMYGSMMPLKQCATISVPEPQQILIRPFDATQIGAISKAIQSSDVGLAPNSDGRVIRLNVPPLSTERRKQLVSRVKELAEEARISIRNIRRDANKHADVLGKDKTLGEDELKDLKDQVQEHTKKFETRVNELAKVKETEVMEE